MKKVLKAAALAAALVPASANAGVNGVTTIVIDNAIGTWLQVAEFQAFGAGGVNYALASNGATASATGQYCPGCGPNGQSGPNNAINGTIGGSYFSNDPSQWIYHTGPASPTGSLVISLAAPTALSSFTIWGRTDCCSDRDVYNVQLFGGQQLLGTYTNLDSRGSNHFATVDLGPISGAVPEPSAWALFILGFGVVGAAQRRRVRIRAFA